MDRPGLYIPLSRRHFLLGLAVGVWTLAACRPQAPPSPTSSLVRQRAAPGELTGVLPNSDLAVGPNNRFLLALLDDRNRPVTDGQVWLRFFKLIDQNTAELRVETMAVYRGSAELGDRGVYVARVGFDQPGTWGVEVQVLRPDGASHLLRLGFEVRAQSQTPAIGSQVPASRTPVAASPEEAEHICSARPPCQFHGVSIADALLRQKPLVVVFATPGFCQSLTCGPTLQVVQASVEGVADRLNVVHVEIYKDARPPEVVPTVGEWRLPSEPWVFLVDSQGRVVDKFEGGLTVQELRPAVVQLVGA